MGVVTVELEDQVPLVVVMLLIPMMLIILEIEVWIQVVYTTIQI